MSQNRFEILILGTAQDGGYPHVGCTNLCCEDAWQNSSLKKLIVDTSGLLAACPKPHMDASCIVTANSESKSISQLSCSMSLTAFSVPTRHGEH